MDVGISARVRLPRALRTLRGEALFEGATGLRHRKTPPLPLYTLHKHGEGPGRQRSAPAQADRKECSLPNGASLQRDGSWVGWGGGLPELPPLL